MYSLFEYRELWNILWRKVGLRTLNEIRPQYLVILDVVGVGQPRWPAAFKIKFVISCGCEIRDR